MSENFQVGDVVRLNSGGPLMTITDMGTPIIGSDIQAFCTWFRSENETVCKPFPFGAIRKVED